MDQADLNRVDLTRAVWHKAKKSGGNAGGGCVEVATNISGIVAVRDSKNPGTAPLVFTPHEWACFLDGARGGEFDLP
ncbi:DUF397 domain-containing protein [Spongiactinospora sp. TRM90649]|uniref:DUF397 domain-containing protein n=1 Tax=Spongiactinospora sp. TRM90649 TaxID=3031114 RepID=UPI0023F69D98|nr:DUF397 domain-containing protein [Spongiactinospora sp. TRM90649]MDF5751247.1 DUF397 domain-containing protein [Spongiactinospora sp. TRM90649]